MTRVRVHNLAMSLDGFVAGPHQSVDAPLGVGGERLHAWVFDTAFGRRMIGRDGGTDGIDNQFLEAGTEGIGATIMGRNMFGPVRGPWPDDAWTGWWGPEPPYHHPVFVLTHYARPPLVMAGGTTFTFVTDGPAMALDMATASAGGQDIRIGGGAATVRSFLDAGVIDHLHLAVAPVVLGSGERMFDGTPDQLDGYDRADVTASDHVAHVVFTREPLTPR
jgi:dihydrofolate reductase